MREKIELFHPDWTVCILLHSQAIFFPNWIFAPSAGLYFLSMFKRLFIQLGKKNMKLSRSHENSTVSVISSLCVSHSAVSNSVTPLTVAHQDPLSRRRRQEYWNGLPFPSLGDPPDLGIEPRSPALQAESSPSEPPGEATVLSGTGQRTEEKSR